MDKLVENLLAGSRRALAQLLTVVENNRPNKQAVLAQLFPHTGQAWVIGVTGAPGTGKSTLVNELTKAYRNLEQTVAILAVDPTSPFSGGAILGDRIRMTDLHGDKGVFIRSMATRGSLGGLAYTTRDAVRVLDAAGFDIVIVETVGAGQSEVDIVRTADTTLVIEAPGLGDDVQAIKAGILEIADILVVNKADRMGADQTVRGLRAMLEIGHPSARHQFTSHHGRLLQSDDEQAHNLDTVGDVWLPPVLKVSALEQDGIDALVDKIASHRTHLQETGTSDMLAARYIEIELHERLQIVLMERLTTNIPSDILQTTIDKIIARDLDPHSAVEQLLIHYT